MQSGKFRHQFDVMKNVESSTNLDSHGRQVVTEFVHATIKGELVKLSGDERLLANQMYGTATHDLNCWYVPGVTEQMWLIGLNGQRFNIVDVTDVEDKNRHLYLVLNSKSS